MPVLKLEIGKSLQRSISFLVLLGVCQHSAIAAAAASPKVKLAVLIISAGFDTTELREIKSQIYSRFEQDRRVQTVVRVEKEQRALRKKNITVDSLDNPRAYIDAAEKLGVDYLLVGHLEKLGPFVQVIFQRFKACSQNITVELEEPVGTTYSSFIQIEMAAISDSMLQNSVPQKCRGKNFLHHPLIAVGAGLTAIYFIIDILTPPEEKDLPGIPVERSVYRAESFLISRSPMAASSPGR